MRRATEKNEIPVIDLFAGPGGLGEGFSCYPFRKRSQTRFNIKLSVEKDPQAHQTLKLRSFKRSVCKGRTHAPKAYYRLLQKSDAPLSDRLHRLFESYPDAASAAEKEALCKTLGDTDDQAQIDRSLNEAIDDARDWVLLGGPPCQAYSLVGRSRNRGNVDYEPGEDHRQFLYKEYLRVIANHLPAVFVMENVKGLLSATVDNARIFEQIVDDLQAPRKALDVRKRTPRHLKPTYRLFALTPSSNGYDGDLFGERYVQDYVVRMEEFGIPQARHRLIIVGVREDLGITRLPLFLEAGDPVPASAVLADLPPLRSGLSKEVDSKESWKLAVSSVLESDWYSALDNGHTPVRKAIKKTVSCLRRSVLDRGNEWVPSGDAGSSITNSRLRSWYLDRNIEGAFNHSTRGHRSDDLHRYLYAACYASAKGESPSLKDFPESLLPNHGNVAKALNGSLFSDRFRVQLTTRPSTTITSHISKDGHYYIHPDPSQCRSLTVREAARLQTFPDNYFFCGPRTSQYTQVGNAVPPLLASQIARVVDAILCEAGVVKT